MGFLASLVLLSTHKRVSVRELGFLAGAYAVTGAVLTGMFFFKVNPGYFALVFLALMLLKPLLFGVVYRDFPPTQALVSFVFSDIAGLAGAGFILVVPAVWDFITSLYLLLVTFLPPIILVLYFLYKKQMSSHKAHFAFVIYPVFSLAALCVVLYLGLTRGVFSATATVAMDPAVILPVAASAFLLLPALRALIFKLRFPEIAWKDTFVLFYAVDISGTLLATIAWVLIKLFYNAPAA